VPYGDSVLNLSNAGGRARQGLGGTTPVTSQSEEEGSRLLQPVLRNYKPVRRRSRSPSTILTATSPAANLARIGARFAAFCRDLH